MYVLRSIVVMNYSSTMTKYVPSVFFWILLLPTADSLVYSLSPLRNFFSFFSLVFGVLREKKKKTKGAVDTRL